jgi:hypothetical protein
VLQQAIDNRGHVNWSHAAQVGAVNGIISAVTAGMFSYLGALIPPTPGLMFAMAGGGGGSAMTANPALSQALTPAAAGTMCGPSFAFMSKTNQSGGDEPTSAPKTPAQKLDELMKFQDRYEHLCKEYDELVKLQEADPYTNYYTDELLEEIMRLRDQWKNFK